MQRRLLGITQSRFDPASRFRFIQFIPHLEKSGWHVDHRPNCPDRQWRSSLRSRWARAVHYRLGRGLMRINRFKDVIDGTRFDVAFVNRDFASEGPLLQPVFTPLIRKCIYDFDDAIFVGPKEKQVRNMCAHSRWVTPGNEYLADYARQFTNRVTVIPTVIDTDKYVARSYTGHANHQRVRVGWSGSDQSIQATLVPYLPMLLDLQRRVDFELVVITNTQPCLQASGLRWSFHQWRQEDEPFLQAQFDIGIMPLVDDTFQKGKCALKLLQYMAAGLSTIASPVGVNSEVVQPGITGMLATSRKEWHHALEYLIRNPDVRQAMGEAGRKRCEQHYSIRRWLPTLLEILERTSTIKAL